MIVLSSRLKTVSVHRYQPQSVTERTRRDERLFPEDGEMRVVYEVFTELSKFDIPSDDAPKNIDTHTSRI